MTLTNNERRLAAQLFKMASDEFGNHGCNDFEKPDYMTRDEWDALRKRLEEFNGTPEEFEPGRFYSSDFFLMTYFAHALLAESDAITAAVESARAEEREACAKVAEETYKPCKEHPPGECPNPPQKWTAGQSIAAAIRRIPRNPHHPPFAADSETRHSRQSPDSD